ncbi:MAG: hypothetical protein KBE41_00170 [Lutibacter sp.]|nr:hypothetical protein [Lutibacter sp.]MBP9599888.1 hypothetical protein [Lutibacter sp.]
MVKKIIVVLTLFITIASFAQNSSASAYSFFGIGDVNKSNTVEELSMGGIGVSMNDSFHLNFSNPASSSGLLYTTYSLALENKNIEAKDANGKEKAATTYLSYLALGIPLGEKGGFSFGLLPNSSVGYNLNTTTLNASDEIQKVTYFNGEGGTNKVFLGVGYEVYKGLSIGVQGAYLFGEIDNSIIHQEKDVSLATKYQAIANVNGFSINTGFQYKKELKNKLNLNLGGSFVLENEITSKGNEYLYSLDLATARIPSDTLLSSESDGKLLNPLKSTLGVGIGKENKWFAGVDYSFQKALELNGAIFNSYSKIKYEDANKISIGGFYIPKYNSITSYWERVTYRAGLKMEKTGLMIDGIGNGNEFTAIDDFGISFGLGLPVGNQLSNLNIGFELGKRGKVTNNLVQENYVNVRLSLSLNDKWFRKLEIF